MLFPGHMPQEGGKHAGQYDPRMSPGRKILIIVAVVLAVLALLWPFLEPMMITTERVALSSEDLPAGIRQLRIAYVTDVHAGSLFGPGRVRDLVTRINALNADLVLLGGDYATDTVTAVEFFENLPLIYSRYGVFAVTGNHDRTTEALLPRLRGAMQSAGIIPLVNEVHPVRVGGSTIYVAGLDDVTGGHPDLAGLSGSVSADDYVIFLCHNPSIIPRALSATDRSGRAGWFDLALFGHTHGGQVALLGSLLHPTGVPERYARGWLRQNRIDMLVSNGVGTTGLPIRLFCPPQIHLITVRTAD